MFISEITHHTTTSLRGLFGGVETIRSHWIILSYIMLDRYLSQFKSSDAIILKEFAFSTVVYLGSSSLESILSIKYGWSEYRTMSVQNEEERTRSEWSLERGI